MAGASDIFSGAGGLLGGLYGEISAGQDRDKDRALQEAAMRQWLGLEAPSIDSMRQSSVGDEQAFNLGPSAMEGIQGDPATRAAQMQALQQMMGVANEGGMDPVSRAQAYQAQADASGYEQGQRGAIAQNMAARGLRGSGNEYAALLAGQQGGANRAAQGGMQAASDARMRALQAMSQGSQMAGQLRGQDFGQDAAKAQAKDAIARFNAMNSQQVADRNLANRQSISNHNAGLYQQDFQNRAGIASGTAGAMRGGGDYYADDAVRQARLGQGLGQAAGTAAGGAYDYYRRKNPGDEGGY